MSISKAIYALIKPHCSCSLSPVITGQRKNFPFAQYQIVSNIPNDDKSGASTLDFRRIQVSVFSKSYTEAEAIAEEIRAGIDAQSGVYDDKTISLVTFLNEIDLFEEDAKVYHKAFDYRITFNR